MQSEMLILLNKPFEGGPVEGPAGGMMRGGHPGGFFLGGLLGGLSTALWAAIIVLLVLWIVRNWSSPRNPITNFTRRAASAIQTSTSPVTSPQAPLEILQTRYAKGEVNREEYEAIRRDLGGETPVSQVSPAAVPSVDAPPADLPLA